MIGRPRHPTLWAGLASASAPRNPPCHVRHAPFAGSRLAGLPRRPEAATVGQHRPRPRPPAARARRRGRPRRPQARSSEAIPFGCGTGPGAATTALPAAYGRIPPPPRGPPVPVRARRWGIPPLRFATSWTAAAGDPHQPPPPAARKRLERGSRCRGAGRGAVTGAADDGCGEPRALIVPAPRAGTPMLGRPGCCRRRGGPPTVRAPDRGPAVSPRGVGAPSSSWTFRSAWGRSVAGSVWSAFGRACPCASDGPS